MQTRGQYSQTYEELIRLGADAKAVDTDGYTVLHHYFNNYLYSIDLDPIGLHSPGIFLDGGEILALLIQAGADPQAINRFGAMPQDIIEESFSGPSFLRSFWKGISLAIWHQALRLCGLSGSTYCNCLAHPRKNIPGHICRCQPCLRGSDKSFQFDTFEEEMSAALAKWDRNAAQSIHWTEHDWIRQDEDQWNNQLHRLDVWVQEVLIELQARQKKAHSRIRADLPQVAGDRPQDAEEGRPVREETQDSNQIGNLRSKLASQDSDLDEDWSTSSSIDSEDEWESAPEV